MLSKLEREIETYGKDPPDKQLIKVCKALIDYLAEIQDKLDQIEEKLDDHIERDKIW